MTSPSPAFLLCACLLSVAPCGCTRPAPPPVPQWLPRVPEGLGRTWDAQATLTVTDRVLALPDGRPCRADDAGCAASLQALRGRRLALELDSDLRMADLSVALATLGAALEDDALVCLAVADPKGRRCVPFRPFSGGEFGEWLDAPKPLGKLRVVMRTDGLEVVTDRGKLPGPDRYGPSLPSIGGKPDYAGLEDAARRLAHRFPDEDTAGLAPSPSITVGQVARVLAALNGLDGKRFSRTFLVYP